MVLDEQPVVRHPQLKLWEWIAEYYLSAVGDVYKAAIPAGLKIESETFVELNPDYDLDENPLTDNREAEICQLLDHSGALSVNVIAGKLEHKGIPSLVNRMIERGILIISEKLVERYRVKRETYVAVNVTHECLAEAFAKLKGARKQEALLLAMLELSGFQRGETVEVRREALLERAQVSPAILSAVEKKGILRIYKKDVNRFKFTGDVSGKLPRLSDAQGAALDELHKSWMTKNVTLLHGVTSSGKTEIYIHLINFVLNRGDCVLYLVPEIALTTQLTRRLQEVFGEKVVIYHSKFSDNERVDIWKKLLHDTEPVVVIGARSSVFLPFSHLGLVIVDEEHESSYKQYDPAPRYNARDAAIVLAGMHGAKTLLGSATPSVETYSKALSGKFGLVRLSVRYQDVQLPEIRVIDMAHARKAGMLSGTFAADTERSIRESLARGAQVILFQNRRGYAPLARCKQCAWVPRCSQCDVALTYHSYLRQLQCHYCGAVYPLPSVCPQCKEPAIEIIGYGTERVEEEVAARFPGEKMLRMDLDTTRNKDSYEHIIDEFSAGKARILVGTQMVTKGLDFGGVDTVAVLNADSIINFPDFRSGERAFNMLEQVSGRAGRRSGSKGLVLIQTYQPSHPVLRFVVKHDYEGYYEREIAERERYFYPPFSRIVYMYVKHRDPSRLRMIADTYAARLRTLLGNRVYGPEEPAVGRVQGLYIRKIMLKIEVAASMAKVKEILRQTYIDMHELPQMKGTVVYYDVDPY
jgi:primosomal protein N' (replication factor Y)